MPNPVTFLIQTQDELKKVTWPKQQEVIRLTFAVIMVSIIVGVFLGGTDFILTKIMEIVLR